MKGKAPSISIFFPAWNEEAYVEKTVARAKAVLSGITDDYEILIINDASTDRTGEIADSLASRDRHVRVVHHPQNRKLGGSLKSGFAAASKEIVVYSDMDLPFDLEEVERAVRLLDYLDADLITGYRFDRVAEGPRRIVYSFVYNALIRALFGVHVKDINFSFKVVRRRVLEHIALKSDGSFIDAELVVRAIRSGFRVFQMGVDYFPRARGESTLSSPRIIVKILRELAQLYPDLRATHPIPGLFEEEAPAISLVAARRAGPRPHRRRR